MENILNKRAKNVQKAFNNKKLIYSIVQSSKSAFALRYEFAQNFKLYFANKNGKPLEERYYFQAFNGAYEETFRKNGLGNISGLSSTIIQAFKLLEDELGKTIYTLSGNHDNICSNFLTTDPLILMKFALVYSPERLWLGPLGGDSIYGLKFPYKLGETKCQYMLRLLESKIPENTDKEKRNKIIEAGKIVCDEFGSKRPRIAIIPESKIGDYPADFVGNYEYCQTKLSELADIENTYWTQNMQSGLNFSSSQGVCVYGNITQDKFTTITIPDIFELIQISAIEKGAKLGDLIDPQNGDIIQKSQEPEKKESEEKTIKKKNKQSLTELSEKSKKILSEKSSNTNFKKEVSKFKGEIK